MNRIEELTKEVAEKKEVAAKALFQLKGVTDIWFCFMKPRIQSEDTLFGYIIQTAGAGGLDESESRALYDILKEVDLSLFRNSLRRNLVEVTRNLLKLHFEPMDGVNSVPSLPGLWYQIALNANSAIYDNDNGLSWLYSVPPLTLEDVKKIPPILDYMRNIDRFIWEQIDILRERYEKAKRYAVAAQMELNRAKESEQGHIE